MLSIEPSALTERDTYKFLTESGENSPSSKRLVSVSGRSPA